MEGSPWGRMGQHYESNGDGGSKSAREGLIRKSSSVGEEKCGEGEGRGTGRDGDGEGKYGRRLGAIEGRWFGGQRGEEGRNGADGGGIMSVRDWDWGGIGGGTGEMENRRTGRSFTSTKFGAWGNSGNSL